MNKLNVLAFGAHHDDVELGVGGSLLRMKSQGLTTGIVSLTRGEMNSRASTSTIEEEANRAASFLGVDVTETLNLGDTRLEDDYERREVVADIIRKYQPDIVLAPHSHDRHLDHSMANRIVKGSNILARVKKRKSEYAPWGPRVFLNYFLQLKNCIAPAFVVDITEQYDQKSKAIRCYESQFAKNAGELGVIAVGVSDYLFHIESRDRYYGSLIDVLYGEAFFSEEPLKVKSLADLI